MSSFRPLIWCKHPSLKSTHFLSYRRVYQYWLSCWAMSTKNPTVHFTSLELQSLLRRRRERSSTIAVVVATNNVKNGVCPATTSTASKCAASSTSGISSTVASPPKSITAAAGSIFLTPPPGKSNELVAIGHIMSWFMAVCTNQFLGSRRCSRWRRQRHRQ